MKDLGEDGGGRNGRGRAVLEGKGEWGSSKKIKICSG